MNITSASLCLILHEQIKSTKSQQNFWEIEVSPYEPYSVLKILFIATILLILFSDGDGGDLAAFCPRSRRSSTKSRGEQKEKKPS